MLSAFCSVWSLLCALGDVCNIGWDEGEKEYKEMLIKSKLQNLDWNINSLSPTTNVFIGPDSLLLFIFEVLDALVWLLAPFIPTCRLILWTRAFFRVWTHMLSYCHKLDVAVMKG